MKVEANSEIANANKRCDEINKIIRKLYEDNVSGRITDERFDYLSRSYEEEQNELNRKVQEVKEILAIVDNDNEKLAKFIRIVKQYTEIEELTPDILHSFVDRIYIGETEVYEGQKFQDIKIVYNLVGAIDLPQYAKLRKRECEWVGFIPTYSKFPKSTPHLGCISFMRLFCISPFFFGLGYYHTPRQTPSRARHPRAYKSPLRTRRG